MKLFVTILASTNADFSGYEGQEGSGSFLEPGPIPVGSCFTCNSMTWDECNRNGRIEKCMDNEQVCQVEVRSRYGHQEIIMGCKWADACQDNKVQNFAGPDGDREFSEYQCKPWSLNKPSVCRQCCNEGSNCALDFLKEGRNGYGPKRISGWQKKMVEYEDFGPITEAPPTPPTEPVRKDGCPLKFLDQPRVLVSAKTSDAYDASSDGEIYLEFPQSGCIDTDTFYLDELPDRNDPSKDLFEFGNTDEFILDPWIRTLPDYCLSPDVLDEIRIATPSRNNAWKFDSISLTITDKVTCEKIYFKFEGGQLSPSRRGIGLRPVVGPIITNARLPVNP